MNVSTIKWFTDIVELIGQSPPGQMYVIVMHPVEIHVQNQGLERPGQSQVIGEVGLIDGGAEVIDVVEERDQHSA